MRWLTVSAAAAMLLVPALALAGPAASIMVLNLDENSGTTTDDEVFAENDGTLLGGATWTPGMFGSAIDFDGSSGSVETTLTQAQPLPLSVEAWVKTTDDSGSIVNKYVANSYNGFQVFMDNSHLSAWYAAPTNRITRTDGSSDVDLQIADGAWHHTITVFDATGTTHYVDGAFATSAGWTGTSANPTDNSTETTPLRLGRYGTRTETTSYFDGTIDGVALYDRVLDLADVQARYNDGPPSASAFPPQPRADIVCLNLDEGQGTTTSDSWTGQEATLNGTDAAGMWTAGGKFDTALQFDSAKSQYVETQLTDTQAPPLTIEAWVKGVPPATGTHVGIINKYQSSSANGFQLFASNGNLAAWYYTPSTHAAAYSALPVDDDLWHHVAAVIDEDGTELFYDGVSVIHAAWTNGMGFSSESTPLRLGTYPTGSGTPDNFFSGSIDEVALYNRALTPNEINARFEGGPPVPAPEPGSLLLLIIGLAAVLGTTPLARLRQRVRA